MTGAIAFTKMTGAGNDFLVVDARSFDSRRPAMAGRARSGFRPTGFARGAPRRVRRRAWPAVARALCDRHRGVGADGLLVLEPARGADARMRVFNADGSEAEMCGNGARCAARYVAAASGRRRVTLETGVGRLGAAVQGGEVTVEMPLPRDVRLGRAVHVGGRRLAFGSIHAGVPHAVIPVADLEAVDVEGVGRAVRTHRAFAPRGTNVDFIQAVAGRPGRIRVRTYERGVEAETLACGTGVTASAIIYGLIQQRGHNGSPRHTTQVETRSGDVLTVSFRMVRRGNAWRISDVTLSGPAHWIAQGHARWPLERAR